MLKQIFFQINRFHKLIKEIVEKKKLYLTKCYFFALLKFNLQEQVFHTSIITKLSMIKSHVIFHLTFNSELLTIPGPVINYLIKFKRLIISNLKLKKEFFSFSTLDYN